MKPFRFDPAARQEAVGALLRYSAISPGLGVRFLEHIDMLVRQACGHPEHCRIYAAPVRRNFSPRFPYSVMFIDRPDEILIVAVMHFKQRPGYWRGRLSS